MAERGMDSSLYDAEEIRDTAHALACFGYVGDVARIVEQLESWREIAAQLQADRQAVPA